MSGAAGPGAVAGVPPALRAPDWEAVGGLVHGFFGRRGGVSGGAWASLNVSEAVGDEAARVAENWRRLAPALSGLDVVRMRQVHGARVVEVGAPGAPAAAADGLVTNRPGLALAVLTADCVPILGVAPSAGAVMALHAGWRGTLAGIAAAGVAAGREWLGIDPAAWHVALGPSIGACCYEVEREIGAALADRWGAMPDAWHAAGARGRLDLRQANRRILAAAGVPEERIAAVGPCTACCGEEYFSHRRSGGCAGRQLSAIGWR